MDDACDKERRRKRDLLPFGKRLNDLLPHPGADVVEGGYDDGDGQDGYTGLAVLQEVDPLLEEEADASATHEADDGGHAHVDVPAIEGEGDVGRYDLEDDGVDDGLEEVGAGGSDDLDGARVNGLQRLGVKLAQGSDGVDSRGQCPNKCSLYLLCHDLC